MSQRLFDGGVSYFQIMRWDDPNFDLKINIGQHDLYFMVMLKIFKINIGQHDLYFMVMLKIFKII